jgi:hypothetical protein
MLKSLGSAIANHASSRLETRNLRPDWRAGILALCMAAALLAVPAASAQTDFNMTVSALTEPAVHAGGETSANIQVTTTGFSGTFNFGCTVTPPPSVPTVSNPICSVSPSSLTAADSATATITTTTATSAVRYTIVITGTDDSGTQSSQSLSLTVLAVAPSYTITVTTPLAPSSVPAGSQAQGVVTVTPVGEYTTPSSGITLYCSAMTPLVTIPPVCSFSYSNGKYITVPGSLTATVIVKAQGPEITGAAVRPRAFYAFWLPLPLLGLVSAGAAVGGKRSRKPLAMFSVFVLCASLLLMPACGNTTASTSTTNGVTPANTYTFTIVGIDGNGVVSSNTGTTVTLTVTAPTS